MKTIRITIEGQDSQEFEVPSTWDECTDHQLTKVWNLQTRTEPGTFELLLLILHLSGVPDELLNRAVEDYGEDADSLLFDLLEVLDFLKTPILLSKSRMAKLFGWRGPKDRLRGLSLENLGLTETLLRNYLQTKTPESLNLFVASIYRPFFLPWTNRFFFIELYAWMARILPHYIKVRMLLNFKGVHEAFMADFPHVYKGVVKEAASKHGWKATWINLTETKFGNYRQTLNTEARLVMVYLDEQGKKDAEIKAKIEKMKRDGKLA